MRRAYRDCPSACFTHDSLREQMCTTRALCAEDQGCGYLPTMVSGNVLPPEWELADTSTPSPGVPFPCGYALLRRTKGTEMRLLDLFSQSRATVAADECSVPIMNAVAHDDRSRGDVVAPGTLHRPAPPPSEEIKRRQVALILRYVVAVRAR
jgi:hypothetical protein